MHLRAAAAHTQGSRQSLSVEERAKAQMVRAGKTAYKKGFAAAQAEMDAGALRAALRKAEEETGA